MDTTKSIITSIDGLSFKGMLGAATAWLERHAPTINALNVFPVPDGDTGTNMLLTMQAAMQELANPSHTSLPALAQAVAYGSLMGARGNSGVILSQILRGIAKSLAAVEKMGGREFAQALAEGSATAYRGVLQPVEGTMLTVVREAAEAAKGAAEEGQGLISVMDKTVEASRQAVARTPLLLDVLLEAGVVDAGGEGLHIILDGFLRYLKGEEMEMAEISLAVPAAHLSGPSDGKMEWGYCTEFIIQGQDLNFPQIRDQISAMGNSTLVVGDETMIRVHIHTFDPGQVLSYVTGLGVLHKVKIDNMQDQHHQYLVLGEEAKAQAPAPPHGVVVVSTGEGIRQVFVSLGAQHIISGGQTMNPSTKEILQAIATAPSPEILLLPNNKNILMAAQEAVKLAQKKVALVPTLTIPQGVGALIAFHAEWDLEANQKAMVRAAAAVQTIEITRAVRSTVIEGQKVKQGEAIALLNDELVTTGKDMGQVVAAALKKLPREEFEVITFYYGQGVMKEEAENLAAQVRELYPDLEVECIFGGQPHYSYTISIE